MSRSVPVVLLTQVPAAVAALIAVGARSAAAQDASPAPPAPAGALVLAAGTNVTTFDHILGRTTRGAAAQLGYERRLGGTTSPFALRLAGDYWSSGEHTFTPTEVAPVPGAAPPGTTYRRTATLAGGGLFGVWHFPAVGPVRAYALAGGGVYHYRAASLSVGQPARALLGISEVRETNTFGYGGGLGAALRLGPVSPFAELRVLQLDGLRHSGVTPTRTPLTLGARVGF